MTARRILETGSITDVRAVTFDVGGTLIQPWPSVGHVYADVAARHSKAVISPETLNRNFEKAWKAKRNFQHTESDWVDLVDNVFAGLLEVPPSRSFFPELYRRFAAADAWRICEDAVPTLDGLASKGIPMAIVSNWDERLRPLLRRLRLESYFEAIVISCEVAFHKPSPVIFEQAAHQLGIPARNILHIGDSRTEDFEGARSAGFQAFLVDRPKADLRHAAISSLRDLTTAL